MDQSFVRDFPSYSASAEEPAPGASIAELAQAQNLRTEWSLVWDAYSNGRFPPYDFFPKDLVEPAEVARLGRNARTAVEQACHQNPRAAF